VHSKFNVGYIKRIRESQAWKIQNGGLNLTRSGSPSLGHICGRLEVENDTMKMMGYNGWEDVYNPTDMFSIEQTGNGEFKLNVREKSIPFN